MTRKVLGWFSAKCEAREEAVPPASEGTGDWDSELKAVCVEALETPGFEEDIVIRAFKILECRLRTLLGADSDTTGTSLAEEAFGKNGPLQLGKTSGEQLGLLRLYSGIFLLNRNASGHRFIHYSKTEALRVVGFVDLLLKWLDRGLEGTTRELGLLKKGEQPQRYHFADLDGDGEKERIVSILRSDIEVFTCKLVHVASTPAGFKSTILLEDQPCENLECHARDINGDNKLELIARARMGDRSEWVRIWQWDAGQFKELTGGGIYSDPPLTEIKDVDGDGREEIIAYKRAPNLPETAHQTVVTTHHWNGHSYQALVSRVEGGPALADGEEDRVKRLVLQYEPRAEAFIREVNDYGGAHIGWWIDKMEEDGREVWRVQLRQWSDYTPLGHTFNHYTVDLAGGKVTSMVYHHADGNLTFNQDWP